MRRRCALVVLAGALACSCGDSVPVVPAGALDVKGTPFRVVRPAAPAPVQEPLGDLDRSVGPCELPPIRPVPPTAPPVQPVASAVANDEEEPTSFDDLAGFECTQFGSSEKHELPAKIQALSGRKVVLDGYMMPLQYEAGGAKKFLLMRYKFGCCYAVSPKLNEWIEVTMDKGVADYIPDSISTVWGVLDIKEETREGAAVGLYKMRASRAEISEAQ